MTCLLSGFHCHLGCHPHCLCSPLHHRLTLTLLGRLFPVLLSWAPWPSCASGVSLTPTLCVGSDPSWLPRALRASAHTAEFWVCLSGEKHVAFLTLQLYLRVSCYCRHACGCHSLGGSCTLDTSSGSHGVFKWQSCFRHAAVLWGCFDLASSGICALV